jgi:hypothetical protein
MWRLAVGRVRNRVRREREQERKQIDDWILLASVGLVGLLLLMDSK